ncbi:MAG: tRNA pseudouridine(38-40) synthase TruA [Verrucomicrobiae bacterium]|nr:tRNA pseudouridine(38-40) synthase TruA [Verrucomicrobiae bacterium]
MRLRMTVAYDGSGYAGWQRVATGVAVQEKIEEALKRIGGQPAPIEGASRTDRGVHASGMVAGLDWKHPRMRPMDLRRALNALLPFDLRILDVRRAPKGFHARFDAKRKLYLYRIQNAPVADPLRRGVCWHVPHALDLAAMRAAAAAFVGRHDFSAVAANPGYARASMVRTVRRCEIRKRRDEILFEVEGDGFLYKMVRTMVGTLVEIGGGRRAADSVAALLASRDRRRAGKTAPAHGLCLVKVFYR